MICHFSYLAQVIGPHGGMVQRFAYSEVVPPKARCQFCSNLQAIRLFHSVGGMTIVVINKERWLILGSVKKIMRSLWSTCHEHRTKEKILVPERIWTWDLPFTAHRYSNHWATMKLWRAGPYTYTSHEPCIWPSSHESFVAQPVRATDRCTEGHRFNSCQGLRFFLCSVLVTCWSHHLSWLLLFPVITELVCLLKFAQAPFHRTWLHTVSK